MQIKPEDLRIGNLVYYQTSEDGLVPNVIDWEDIKMCVENPDYFNENYKGIPLNWALAKAIGLTFDDFGDHLLWKGCIGEWGVFDLYNDADGIFWRPNSTMGIQVKYFHQLENALYYNSGEVFWPDRERLSKLLDPSKLCEVILSDNGEDLPF
jgi:hypothetical protein